LGNDAITFSDENLELAIRSQLIMPFGFLTSVDMLSLQVLDARGFGITDLGGLESATNLQTLILTDNNISDLRPLTNLTVLQSIELDNNDVFDLTPLQGLLGLRALTLCGNDIDNLNPLVTNSRDGGLGANDQIRVDCSLEETDPSGIAVLLAANADLVCCDGASISE
jgi:Leucine-rich repeat (LRR) protein